MTNDPAHDPDWASKIDLDAVHEKRRGRARRDDARRAAFLDKQEKRRKARADAGLPLEVPAGHFDARATPGAATGGAARSESED